MNEWDNIINEFSVDLKGLQSMDLNAKIEHAESRIIDWYEHYNGKVYVSFSGGKDSTVLLHIVRNLYPNVIGVFSNTGLEYPEIVKFVKTFNNIEIIRPEKSYAKVIKEYGYPIISKKVSNYIEDIRKTKSNYIYNLRLMNNINGAGLPFAYQYLIEAPFKISDKCCQIIKKNPLKKYEERTGLKPFIGIMAGDSIRRKQSWSEHKCNAYDLKSPQSRPLMIWGEKDVDEYIKQEHIEICEIYEKNGLSHTGCMWCMFGLQFDNKPNRFEKMKETHPKIYEACINKMGLGMVLDFIGEKY